MKRFENALYALIFLPLVACLNALTLLLRLSGFRHWLARKQRRAGLQRLLYLEVFFPENAGYHYRSRKWADVLREHGAEVEIQHVFEREEFDTLLKTNFIRFQRHFLFKRLAQCFATTAFSCVIVRRELLIYNDYGNLFLDKLLLALHPNVILDFDDDIAAAKREPRPLTAFGRLMREHPAKFGAMLRLYPRFIVGSRYLKGRVLSENPHLDERKILIIPTCVDYAQYEPKSYEQTSDKVNFGWVGSNNNLKFLQIVIPALNQAARRHRLRLIVISGQEYHNEEAEFEIVNVKWTLAQEIENLRLIDIGLMPLHDTPVERGKCGFKLIQYMGLGIVGIASAITINAEIVSDGQDGFLVPGADDWPCVVEHVLARRDDFTRLGAAARRKIAEHYSFVAHRAAYVEFIAS